MQRSHPILVVNGLAAALSLSSLSAAYCADPTIKQLEAEIQALKRQVTHLESQASGGATSTKTAPARTSTGTTPVKSSDGKSTVSSTGGSNSNVSGANDKFFDVPDSPSAQILGVSATPVRPSTPQQLIPAILNGVDKNGNFKTGVAIDFVPFNIMKNVMKPETPSLADYHLHTDMGMDSILLRDLSRTQISFATAKGAGASDTSSSGMSGTSDKSLALALGVQTTLFDQHDLLFRHYTKGFAEDAGYGQEYLNQLGRSWDQQGEVREQFRNQEDNFLSSLSHTLYNSAWDVGAAKAWLSPDGTTSHFRDSGYGIYSTYTYGFEGMDALTGDSDRKAAEKVTAGTDFVKMLQRNVQLLLQLSYRNGELIPNPSAGSSFLRENTTEGSLRLRMGTQTFNGSLIESLSRQRLAGHESKTAHETSFELEYHIANNTYLTVSVGKEFDNADGKNPVVALGGLKFGMGGAPAPGESPQ